ncbi:MAG: DUF1127 domain-containing protein [Hyphomicrobiales bacterium]
MATVITSGRTPSKSVLSSILSGASDFVAYVRRYREYARAESQLKQLSTRELDDIGLRRSEIHACVWANF